ncbi:caldesmon isoform x5 [Limosa lapponica baueri]|uniref:Caldesmon isoform x5 n=1 Tax=Limosa lapponica baueri TaxID=1758121 RepID=A0A2I0T1V6_LIMLA|nr:caldesmon isoform x5 [Limosa lapponica baueri]
MVSPEQVKDDKDKGKSPKEEMKSVWDRKKGAPEQKAQNGEREITAPKLKSTENAFGAIFLWFYFHGLSYSTAKTNSGTCPGAEEDYDQEILEK